MKFDIVRQPLMAAFLMLLICAVSAMARTYGFLTDAELLSDAPALLGGYIRVWQDSFPIVAKMIALLLIFYAGSSLGRMTVRYGLYGIHTYLAVSLYGILACGIFVSSGFIIEYFVSVLLVLAVKNYCVCSRNGAYCFGLIFRGSFYLGLIPLVYAPGLVLMAVVPLVCVLFKRSVRELLVAVVGYLLPFFLVCYLNWAFGGEFFVSAEVLWRNFLLGSGFSFLLLSLPVLILLGVLALLLLGAALCYFSDMRISGSKSRSILLFNFMLLGILLLTYFVPSVSVASVAMIAVPCAVIFPLLFVRIDRRIAFLLFFTLIGLCVSGICI